MIGDPPLLAGAVNATTIWLAPGVAPVTDGAPGTPGDTEVETADHGPVPLTFSAATRHV